MCCFFTDINRLYIVERIISYDKMADVGSVIVIIVTVIAGIILAIVLFEMYRQQKWIFAPYMAPPLANGFQPLKQVIKLTAQEQAERKQVYSRPAPSTNS